MDQDEDPIACLELFDALVVQVEILIVAGCSGEHAGEEDVKSPEEEGLGGVRMELRQESGVCYELGGDYLLGDWGGGFFGPEVSLGKLCGEAPKVLQETFVGEEGERV